MRAPERDTRAWGLGNQEGSERRSIHHVLSCKQLCTTNAIRLELGINQNTRDKMLLEESHPLSALFNGQSCAEDCLVLSKVQREYHSLFFDTRLQPDELVFVVAPHEGSSVARCHFDEDASYSYQVTHVCLYACTLFAPFCACAVMGCCGWAYFEMWSSADDRVRAWCVR